MRYKWLPRPERGAFKRVETPHRLLPDPIVSVLKRRGFGEDFVDSGYTRLSPWNALPGTEEAATLLAEAIRKNRLIFVHGDYDADGVTATATAIRLIKALGGRTAYHIPSRFDEGYGIGKTGIDRCIDSGAGLFVTVDCGISSAEEVALLRSKGVKVVVTDHHVPPGRRPDADALVNPALWKRTEAPWSNLAGAGVVFFVLRGLAEMMGVSSLPELEPDLVSIGTVCDMVELTGDNRILVKRGLSVLRYSPPVGVAALLSVAGLKGEKLSAADIGYTLGPRINAAGRMQHANIAVDLLMEKNPDSAAMMARSLEATNARRREVDRMVFQAAAEKLSVPEKKIGIASSDDWHSGVIGIAASRLAREQNRPVVLISWKDTKGRASARGVPGMPVYPVLARADELGFFSKFGGHEQAAGFSIERDRYPEFKKLAESLAESYYGDLSKPVLYIDGRLTMEDCKEEFLRAVEYLEPFGMGNPEPVWILRGVYPASFRSVGSEGQHLQISFQSREHVLRGIGFGMGHRTSELDRSLDVAFTLAADSWRDDNSVQLMIKDFKPAARLRK